MKHYLKRVSLVIFLLLPFYSLAENQQNNSDSGESITRQEIYSLLQNKPGGKGTVGAIPYTRKDGEVFILLAREDINGPNKKKAGTYADFGGSTKSNQTFLENMLRELKEETMGLLNPTPKYLLDNGRFVVKQNSKRTIIYSLFPANKGELYIKAEQLNRYRDKKFRSLSQNELEKDDFAWLPLKKLIIAAKNGAITMKIKDIDGKLTKVNLRQFFVEDFLKNPMLEQVLEELN